MTELPHRRMNLLTGEWVLVSPHRLERPWQGAIEATAQPADIAHDPHCYLCPGARRAHGADNPPYVGVYIFDNDFPALLAEGAPAREDSLLRAAPESGACRVICYAPEHHLTLARLPPQRIRPVIDAWAAQFAELAAREDIGAVTIFENRGAMMGASNPHPHGQIWATASVPDELAREDKRQRAWADTHSTPMLIAYLERERAEGARVVCESDSFAAIVPFWAAWPFETIILPKRAISDLTQLDAAERDGLAALLSDLTIRYDNLFQTPFPYTMGWHQRPTQQAADAHFVAHAHFYPPLLRSAEVRKFMVGFEMLAMPQRDITPEDAAARLRAAGGTHYLTR